MLVAVLLMGALAAYYFGLRIGAWTAAGTAILCAAALVVPLYAVPIYVVLAVAAVAILVVGPRRAKPTDAVRVTRTAVHVAKMGVSRIKSIVFGSRDQDDKNDGRRNGRDRGRN